MPFTENSKPIYLQIVDRICDQISQGCLLPGQRMPSVREYASQLQVNVNTVMRAYDKLASEGIIANRRGIGFFLEQEAPASAAAYQARTFFSDEITYFFSRLAAIGLSPDELAQKYSSYLKSK